MPSLAIYLDAVDARTLLAWLNAEREIAFVLSEGGVLRTADTLARLAEGRHRLWHKPTGKLPLLEAKTPEQQAVSGWLSPTIGIWRTDRFDRLDESHPAVLTLDIQHQRRVAGEDVLGLSTIGWIGNRYASLGKPAMPETQRWWRRLQAWVKGHARRISRLGPLDVSEQNLWAWAFPSALGAITAGRPRALNPL